MKTYDEMRKLQTEDEERKEADDIAACAAERTRFLRRWMFAAFSLLWVLLAWQAARGCQRAEQLARVSADAKACHADLEKMTQKDTADVPADVPAPKCPACPGCPPPPPACTESGQLAQCSLRLEECATELNWREQKVDFGKWYADVQEQANEKIADMRVQYLALLEEFQPVKARAVEMGLGPHVRDWITKPGASDLFIELGARWAEIEHVYGQMRQVIQEAEQRAERTCYQNLVWSWDGIIPSERDHYRQQQQAYELTDGKYFIYLYELDRQERREGGQR